MAKTKKPVLKAGSVVSLEVLDEHLDVSVAAWARTLSRLVRTFRKKGLRVEIPAAEAFARYDGNVSWVRLYEAQVEQLPAMDRGLEFRMARRYEFIRARLDEALTSLGFAEEELSSLRVMPEAELPLPKKAGKDEIRHLGTCREEFQRLRNLYVEGGLYMVLGVVRRYRGLGVDDVDLIQEGNASLFQALDGFDWRRDVRFKTYAQYWIHQAILKALYDTSRTVRVPVWVQKAWRKIRKVQEQDRHVDGRMPTEHQIGEALGMEEQRVADLMGARKGSVSLDARIGGEDDLTLAQVLPDEDALGVDQIVESSGLVHRLTEALADLPGREREILERRFGLGGHDVETLAEIAVDFGVSAERIRQLQQAALRKLQDPDVMRRLPVPN